MTAWFGEEVGNPVAVILTPEGIVVALDFVDVRRSPPPIQLIEFDRDSWFWGDSQ